MKASGVTFRTAAHRAELITPDLTLRVQRGRNGRRYRADVTGEHHSFLETATPGLQRDRMKRIINGSEADAWTLLRDLTTTP